jgi:GDP-mannose 4,6-dehydratase
MPRALITGVTGMVGSHLTDYLLEATDWDIFGLARWRSPLDNILHLSPIINSEQRLELIYGDLNDDDSLRSAIRKSKPDFVFHLAAQSFPLTSFSAPIQTLETNMNGTFRLLNAVMEFAPEARVHVCSSSEVFGRVPREYLPIKEDTPFHPASPYAISKVGTDLIGKFFSEAYNLHVVITRMFTHTGPRRGDVFAESSFAKQIAMIEAGLIDQTIKVGNLQSLRTFADVRDAVRAYYMCLSSPIPSGSVFNIGGTFTCTIGEMLNCLISMSSHTTFKVMEDPHRIRPIDADLQIPDTSAFKNLTGWKPEISFEKTMSDLLNYWRDKISSLGSAIQR